MDSISIEISNFFSGKPNWNEWYFNSLKRKQWAELATNPNNWQFNFPLVPSFTIPNWFANEQEQQNPWLFVIGVPFEFKTQPQVGFVSEG